MNTELKNNKKIGSAMVVGACIGGVMAQLDKTFPTNDCAMCTMAPRLVEVGRHKDIEIITLADIENIAGKPGNFTVTLNKKPRYIDEEKCTGCGVCVENCPVRNEIYLVPDEEREEIRLSTEDKKVMKRIIEEYQDKNVSLVTVLQNINEIYSYLPENILRYISQKLDIPLSLIYRIATFYKAFSLKPRGKNIITVCMGTTCHVKRAPMIINALERELGITTGETTEDMNFTLETVACLGCCGLAPVMTIGEDLYGKLTQAKIPKIIE